MKFTKDPAEQTTAITDIILALVAFGGILILCWNIANNSELWKVIIWSAAFGWIGLAAALGAVAHGLVISRTVHDRIWQLLNMSLALAVSLFVAGVVYDLWGLAVCLKVLPVMLIAGLGFFGATLLYPGIFFVFLVYEGLALIFALSAYIYLAVWGELSGAGIIAGGILVSILAAAIQANKSISLTVIWQFDHNGIYHMVQAAGLLLLVYGIRLSLL
ncbi:hypothetical protein D1BOALGB6SA_8289 [Olavius sp. associated proteobacterium Delta 1]|nr:hypothetical protein D1BOALGB6SA_8289 [Olavius sp. associated proteobacterium Delta 1]